MLALVTHDRVRRRPPVFCGPRRLGSAGVSSLTSVGISAGVGLAEDAIGQWIGSARLRGGQKIATSELANQLATELGNLDKAYFAAPPSCANQRAALDAFDQAWDYFSGPAGCGNMQYGSAGERCVSERAPGGVYDASRANRDPIANDPRLIGAGCDTAVSVLLPTASGAVAPVVFQSSNGSPAPAGGSTIPLAAGGASSLLPYVLGGLLLYLVVK